MVHRRDLAAFDGQLHGTDRRLDQPLRLAPQGGGASPFRASDAPREKGVSATDELDLGPIFSNIALALRQLEPEEKGISDAWRGDVFQSSFQSVSFASPFEDRERSLGAELRSAL
ncbi:MAG: hypothetical protein IJR14_08360 [Synergistaceae bacterium]|nr:hypothetical protein [Synergistaceae bacterium]